jgi:P4 family phage/plasmid primase-like protien
MTIEIPKQLQNPEFRFCLIRKQSKAPYENDWANKGYEFNNPKLLEHLKNGGNYGVIGGYGKLIILDKDKTDLPIDFETFTVETGSGGKHFYLISDYEQNHVFIKQFGELRAKNYQVVGVGSTHPNGRDYKIFKDLPILQISKEELKKIIEPYLRKEEIPTEQTIGDASRSGLEYRKILSLLKEGKTREQIYKIMSAYSKWVSAPEQYRTMTFEKAENFWLSTDKTKQKYGIMTRRGQLEEFWQIQPFYYDTSNIFWLWNKENFKWEISDEVSFCNSIFETLNVETIDTKIRTEIIIGFKQIGRLHKPKPMKKSWVQFKDKIYDIETGDIIPASADYFITNPIPWKVGESEETPTIDKYFDDWMKGQDTSWKETLYQIIAYNISKNKFMQRIIALVGGGSNGKGTFIKLNYKFLGDENIVASEIKQLSEDKFEPAVLFGKLLCVMGEVSYDDLKNTNQLKKLGGEDKISFQFKGKTPFTEENTATCICLTNSMPITPDKTQGFYRKWLIIDFLNQFTRIDKNLIDSIPEIEFENLAKKTLRILKELYQKPHFTNEGTFEDRAKRYEERSNPVLKFVEEECEEIDGEMVTLREFSNRCNSYLKEKHLRILTSNLIGKILRNEGFIVGNRKIRDCSAVVILNLSIKKLFDTIETIKKPVDESHAKLNKVLNSFGGFDGKNEEKKAEIPKQQETETDTDTERKQVESPKEPELPPTIPRKFDSEDEERDFDFSLEDDE